MGYTTTKEILKKAHTELHTLATMSEGSELHSSIVRHGTDDFHSLVHEVKRIEHYAKELLERKFPNLESMVEQAGEAKNS